MKSFIFAFLISCSGLLAAEKEPWDFREETIYFVMTDRFVDGDPSNNSIYADEYIPGNLKYYQGGDFKGLIDNLDHIKDMGFSAIWITPPVMQPPGRYQNFDRSYDAAGYHGYWAWDLSKVDPHLESPGASYSDLIKAAHTRGMKVIQDVVANHGHGGYVNPSVKWYEGKGKIYGLGRVFDYDNDKENWFNHKGPVIADLLDFNEDNPETVKWLIEIYKGWQNKGVDAFRIDTVVWMKKEFWKKFTEEMHKNRKDFFLFGEVWTNDDYDLLASYTKLSSGEPMNSSMSVLDMPGSSMGNWGKMEKVFKGGDYSLIDEVLKNDGKYRDATYLVTYLDNHDKPRFNGPEWDGSPASLEQYTDALNYYFTARGIPCIYYGTEIMMSGGNDPDNRKVLGIEGIKSSKNSPVYLLLKRLNSLRRSSMALQKGKQYKIFSSRDQYAFKRQYKGEEVFVFLNKASEDMPFIAKIPKGLYVDLYSGEKFEVKNKNGFRLNVSAHSLRVLRKSDN
ncbi:MAG: alpha-amylase family glycosyl hydrolase [Elusimicrobiota bacterium]